MADLPEAVPHECPDKFMYTEDEVYELLCSLAVMVEHLDFHPFPIVNRN